CTSCAHTECAPCPGTVQHAAAPARPGHRTCHHLDHRPGKHPLPQAASLRGFENRTALFPFYSPEKQGHRSAPGCQTAETLRESNSLAVWKSINSPASFSALVNAVFADCIATRKSSNCSKVSG